MEEFGDSDWNPTCSPKCFLVFNLPATQKLLQPWYKGIRLQRDLTDTPWQTHGTSFVGLQNARVMGSQRLEPSSKKIQGQGIWQGQIPWKEVLGGH